MSLMSWYRYCTRSGCSARKECVRSCCKLLIHSEMKLCSRLQ